MLEKRLEVGSIEDLDITMSIEEKSQMLNHILNFKEDCVEMKEANVTNNDSVTL